MVERKERRRIARVTLSGTQTVQTHEGVVARLLDLSLSGAGLAHCGILRPGSRCFVHLPVEFGALRLPAQILWCMVLGAEVGPDGERYLQSQSGLWFPTLTESQGTVLARILQQARSGEPHPAGARATGRGPLPQRSPPDAGLERSPAPGAGWAGSLRAARRQDRESAPVPLGVVTQVTEPRRPKTQLILDQFPGASPKGSTLTSPLEAAGA